MSILPLGAAAMNLNSFQENYPDSGSNRIMPVLFVGHGSPMNAIEDNQFSREWRRLGQTLPQPSAILCISAHWETRGTMVTAMEKPRTIHDFGGFPKALFDVQYPAPGHPELARETSKTIVSSPVGLDEQWGLDHGAWSVIRPMFPEAKIPVFQMSLDYMKTPQQQYELARELAFLRKKGVLILASGNMVHNLRMVAWDRMNDPNFGFDWAREANEKMKELIVNSDHQSLIRYQSLGKSIQLAVPTPDHFLPLLYALALREKDEPVAFFNDQAVMGSLTMTSLIIG
jgi:4,5-DOPA dioxygenase extradiol